MKRRAIIITVILGLALATLPFICGGCTTEQLEKTKQELAIAKAEYKATTQAATQAAAEIAKLPADDPLRKVAESRLAWFNQKAAELDRYIMLAEAAITAAEKGDFNDPALTDAVGPIPYGRTALALAGIGLALWRQLAAARATKKATQLATALDAVTPNETLADPRVAAALDDSTKAFAGGVIAKLPDAPAPPVPH